MRRRPASMDAHDHDPALSVHRTPFDVEARNARLQTVPDDVDEAQLFLVGVVDLDAADLVGGPVLRLDAEDEIAARRVRKGADVGEELTLVPVASANRLSRRRSPCSRVRSAALSPAQSWLSPPCPLSGPPARDRLWGPDRPSRNALRTGIAFGARHALRAGISFGPLAKLPDQGRRARNSLLHSL